MLPIKDQFSRLKARLTGMKSENWGGVAGFTGSAILCLSGDAPGVASMAASLAGDYMQTRYGETSRGYSLGYALFVLGDGLFACSAAAQGNTALQFSLTALAVTCSVGALRYPLERLAEKLQDRKPVLSRRMQRTADLIQPAVGSLSFLQLLLSVALSGYGKNHLALASTALWATSDILLGRVQDYLVRPMINVFRKKSGSSPEP